MSYISLSPSDHEALPTGDYRGSVSLAGGEMPVFGLDLAPFEPFACVLLTERIRSFLLPTHGHNGMMYRPVEGRGDTLEAALDHAACAIRHSAKWFSPALSDLLLSSLEAANASSSSSAVLYAALALIDIITIYSVGLPQNCVRPTARFIAKTYYSASRAHKTRRIAERAWNVTLNMLKSHLGQHFLDEILYVIGSDFDNRSKEGFAQTAGAIMLTTDRLGCQEAGLAPVSVSVLVLKLRAAAASKDSIIREHVTALLSEIISTDEYLQQLRQYALWDPVLDIIDSYVTLSSELTAAKAFVSSLSHAISHMERERLPRVASIFVRVGLSLTELLSEELMAPWTMLMPIEAWNRDFDGMVKALSIDTAYTKELSAFVSSSVVVYMESRDLPETVAFIRTLQDHIATPTTTVEAADSMSSGIATLLKHSLEMSLPSWQLNVLFGALCEASQHSIEAIKLLYRIRRDVLRNMYLEADPHDEESNRIDIVEPLPLKGLVAAICNIFNNGARTWEIFEYVLLHTKSLLSNHALFAEDLPAVVEIQTVVRTILESGIYTEPPAYTGLTKSHVAAQLVQTLTTVVSYHRQLRKPEILDLVSVFDATAGSRDYIVSTQCIHALTVCCYEVPDLVSPHMDGIINKMSRMATQRFLAIHVLHFLAGLSRLPDLYHNFKPQQYKRIFGVCHSYLQSTRGTQTMIERKQTPTSERSSMARSEEALPEYVYALAHHVITFWYMSLRSSDRESLKEYITGCLEYEDPDGSQVIEDQGLVTLDMMDRIDAEPESGRWYFGEEEDTASRGVNLPDPFTEIDGKLIERDRLVGMLLITTKTSLRTGKTLVTVRRPSGNAWRIISNGKEKATITVDGRDTDFIEVWPPEGQMGRTYGTIATPMPWSPLHTGMQSGASAPADIISLPEGDAVKRHIEAFDRMSALDSHKAGVIYIGESQTTEDRVFPNISGSPDYREFVRGLGALQRLKGADFNTQGLDRADDMDGEYAIVWRNQVTESVFHVTTMMPNSDDARENTAKKKRHVGNDHVNIIFNNSGDHLDFGKLYSMFPGQLTYVYVVITPSARTSFVEARTQNIATDKRDRFYCVQVVTRPDYPNVSPAAEEKVVSGASLPGFVRNLVLNNCLISLMWTVRHESSEYPSSWRSRLHQLRRIAERFGTDRAEG